MLWPFSCIRVDAVVVRAHESTTGCGSRLTEEAHWSWLQMGVDVDG